MADWKDFFEDNKESLGQYLDSLAGKRRSTEAKYVAPAPIQFCPICHFAFISDRELDSHIKHVHGPQHAYLRVNGQIVREVGWAERGISELRVVLLGYSTAAIELEGADFLRNIRSSGDNDLTHMIPQGYEGEVHVAVSPNSGKTRRFTLFSRSLPTFRRDDLDAIVLASVSDGATDRMPDIGRWRERAGSLGTLENRYLNGFYEYVLAFQLSADGQKDRAKEHFEEAFSLLLPFRTALAHSAQCVLGLRMNCFGVLDRASGQSPVSASNVFFNQCYGSGWAGGHGVDRSPFLTRADEFTVRLVRVVADFYNDDFVPFATGLAALEFHPYSSERNNHDKLLLLRARSHRRAGETRQAKTTYEMLRFHPFFGTEAEEFLNGQRQSGTTTPGD